MNFHLKPIKPQSVSSEGVLIKVVFMIKGSGSPYTRFYRDVETATKFAQSVYCANVYDDKGNRLRQYHS